MSAPVRPTPITTNITSDEAWELTRDQINMSLYTTTFTNEPTGPEPWIPGRVKRWNRPSGFLSWLTNGRAWGTRR